MLALADAGMGEQAPRVSDSASVRVDASAVGGSLCLRASPALTPEDSFAAIVEAAERGLHAPHGECSFASTGPQVGESPRGGGARTGRLRRGCAAIAAVAGATRGGIGAGDKDHRAQLVGIIQQALLGPGVDPDEGHLCCTGSLQSVSSMHGMGKLRPGGPEHAGEVRGLR